MPFEHRLSKRLSCRLTLKVETINPIGSFKGRGATESVVFTPPPCTTPGNPKHGRIATILCGSNFTQEQIRQWLTN